MKKLLSHSLGLLAVAVAVFGLNSCNNAASNTPASSGNSAETEITKGSIVYIDLDRILQEYDMANDLRSVVETKVQNIQAEVNRRGKQLENDVNSFQDKINKGLITRSVAEAQSAKLQQQEQEFNDYAQQRQNEINEEQAVMLNQLSDAIKTYVDKYNESKHYSMILTNTGGVPVITADKSLDITDEILAGLNEEYVKDKNKNKK